jgi:hypothetical protein
MGTNYITEAKLLFGPLSILLNLDYASPFPSYQQVMGEASFFQQHLYIFI